MPPGGVHTIRALAPAAYASQAALPPPAQGSLPAGWLAFAGRGSNPLDRYERFQSALTSSSFPGLILSQAGCMPNQRALIWWFYRDLKAYRREPTPRRRSELRARFDRLFGRRTGFVVLDRLLARLHANKSELLRVLDRPDIPLHTNGSENDIRAQVTRRKVSGGTRSDMGRDCRDVFLSLMKTCQKLGVSFWDYLGTRLAVPDQPAIPYLPDLVRTRFRPA